VRTEHPSCWFGNAETASRIGLIDLTFTSLISEMNRTRRGPKLVVMDFWRREDRRGLRGAERPGSHLRPSWHLE